MKQNKAHVHFTNLPRPSNLHVDSKQPRIRLTQLGEGSSPEQLSSNTNTVSNSVSKDEDTVLSLHPIKTKKSLTLQQEENLLIEELIEGIWNTFNKDSDNILSKGEMAEFIYITLIEAGVRDYNMLRDCEEDPTFSKVFQHFDIDGDGTVDREELAKFIRDVSGMGK